MTTATPQIEAGPLAGLAEELRRQLETKRDLMAGTSRISFSDLTRVAYAADDLPLVVDLPDGAEAFDVTRHAHGQIATHLEVPLKLYDRLYNDHPPLFENLINGLFVREPSVRMLRTMDGKVRAFLSDKYRPRDNWDLLDEAILPALKDVPARVVIKEATLTDTRMYLKLFLPDMEKPVTPKVGDAIRGGLIIQNSEVGAGRLLVAPYTDRLICLNGMVHTEYGQSRYHVGRRIKASDESVEAWDLYSDETLKLDDEAFFAKVRDTVRATLNEAVFDKIVEQMRDLADTPVAGAPQQVIEVLAKKHTLNETEQGSMLKALIEGADVSAWGYVNALTATARDLDDRDRAVELETLAGSIVSDGWAEKVAVAA